MQRNVILHGDAWALAKTLPDESINCIATSPPYFNQRDYGTAQWEGGDPECDHRTGNQVNQTKDVASSRATVYSSGVRPGADTSRCSLCGARRVDAQFGLESSPEEFVDKLVDLFRELRRALRHDGTVWLNLGSSYAGSGGAGGDYNEGGLKAGQPRYKGTGKLSGYKAKDLIMIPAMVAIALQKDGWWLRQEIVWGKLAPMPESVTDRCTRSHEMVYMLTKSPVYHYDAEAIAEASSENSGWAKQRGNGVNTWKYNDTAERKAQTGQSVESSTLGVKGRRNRRSVWTLGPEQFPGSHFAVMPTKLVEPCILAGCPAEVCAACGNPYTRVVEYGEYNKKVARGQQAWTQVTGQRDSRGGLPIRPRATTGFSPTCTCDAGTVPGIVLDPFLGSGTTAVVARSLGRDFLGFELNADYIKLAEQRIGKTQPALFAA